MHTGQALASAAAMRRTAATSSILHARKSEGRLASGRSAARAAFTLGWSRPQAASSVNPRRPVRPACPAHSQVAAKAGSRVGLNVRPSKQPGIRAVSLKT